MQKLVVVRHGSVGPDNNLDVDGKREVARLGKRLASAFDEGCKIHLLSSDTPHACESAEILGKLLGVPYTYHEELWSDLRSQNLKGVFGLVRAHEGADVLILVTHRGNMGKFPKFFSQRMWRTKVRSHDVPQGTGWMLDCSVRTLAYLH
ncbi:MAG: Protein containing Phosphoglycerate mutase // Nucleotidyltransferase [Patescibacteria group bacterium]|jgi:phosphohistidine phosphatase SixA|nr:histidine phosphatase family protein [Candidatus Paceibacterota bacterium]MDQ5928068.1 Protein containing Phosphoglycerate mutase // Nucleotidyltransferase [Patescibacteria group bacterium]